MKALDLESKEHFEKRIKDLERQLRKERTARKEAETLLSQAGSPTSSQFAEIDPQALGQSTEFLTAILRNLPSGIILTDQQDQVVFANAIFKDIFRWEDHPDQQLGMTQVDAARHISRLMKDPEEWLEVVEICVENDATLSGEVFELVDDRVLEFDFFPIISGGRRMGHLCSVKDVTDQRKVQLEVARSEEKYRGVMENLQLGLLEFDTNGNITKAYKNFCKMTGYTREELVGQRARELLVPDEFIPLLEQLDEQQEKGQKTGVYEIQLTTKSDDRIWVLVTSAPIFDYKGQLTGYLDIIYDMTSRKLLEQELNVAKEQAERSREAEKQFLANMSHEIRNPINAIIGISNLLYDTQLTKEQLGFVDNIKYSGDMLLGLISGILDLSKIESGAVDLLEKNLDLHSTIQAIIHSISFKAKQKPIVFRYEKDPRINFRVMADRVVLNQIFSNLLVNAEKFTDKGKIEVRSKFIGITNGKAHLAFSVSDTGIGIAKNKLTKIFETFEQADRETKLRYGGTGLGLAIVKQLVSRYGGGVSVSSKEKKGSTFQFDMHFSMAEEIEDADRSVVYKSFEESRILIVEDNRVNQQYLAGILDKWFFAYDLASNGSEALELLNQNRYQLILMDIRMPEMDGYEATIRIRSEEDNPNHDVPIIALTASALVDEKERALAAGMNYHLTKPFSPEDLGLVLSKFNLIEAVEVDKPDNFTFSTQLDSEYLDEFYQGDLQRAALMFDVFLKVIDGEMDKLEQLKEEQDWNAFSSQAHKIKPNFMMVGLREFSEKMKYFEGAKKYADLRKMISLQFDEVRRDFENSKALIEKELVRLREFT